MIKPLIMTGDFSMLPPLVAQTVSQRYGYHREAWFQNILINLTDYFSKIFGSDYQPLILTCTLAGAYEAIAANFLDNSSTVLLSVDSVFKKYAAIWGGENIIFDPHGENDDFSGSKARPTLAFLDAASASGRLLDLQQAAEKIKQLYPQCLIAADISTSFGADQCEFSATIDAYLISSEKALMGLPGLTLVIVKKAVLNQLSLTREKLLQRPFLLDLLKAYQIWESKKTTPYSPNISAAIALSAALKLIEQKI